MSWRLGDDGGIYCDICGEMIGSRDPVAGPALWAGDHADRCHVESRLADEARLFAQLREKFMARGMTMEDAEIQAERVIKGK